MTTFSPREIVSELDRFIVGQNDAKRAVAIALRNRWRRPDGRASPRSFTCAQATKSQAIRQRCIVRRDFVRCLISHFQCASVPTLKFLATYGRV